MKFHMNPHRIPALPSLGCIVWRSCSVGYSSSNSLLTALPQLRLLELYPAFGGGLVGLVGGDSESIKQCETVTKRDSPNELIATCFLHSVSQRLWEWLFGLGQEPIHDQMAVIESKDLPQLITTIHTLLTAVPEVSLLEYKSSRFTGSTYLAYISIAKTHSDSLQTTLKKMATAHGSKAIQISHLGPIAPQIQQLIGLTV